MVVVFTMAALMSATLLFAVQPLATRMVLPDFGGSAAVWTTSVLFFQVALLLGYVYTHVATTRLTPRTQVVVHLVAFVVPVVALPLAVVAAPGGGGTASVVLRLLAGLAVGVGGPFLLVSTSGPLLQRWFSWTDHPRAHDPYFLYAASNIGSIVGLLAYPLVVEPRFDLDAQATLWSWGYGLLGLMLLSASWWVRRTSFVPSRHASGGNRSVTAGWRRVATWVGLAFLPSSLMLGVTTFLSTDIAAVPLFWVVPLATYLATFVVAFSRWSIPTARSCRRVVAPVTILAATAGLAGLPIAVTVALVIASFAAIAMVVHGRLADSRPSAHGLTAFYVWMSVGGALGGLANGIVAPLMLPGPFEFAMVGLAAAVVVGRPLDELVGGPGTVKFWMSAGVVVAGTLVLGMGLTSVPLDRALLVVVLAALTALLAVTPVGRSQLAVVCAVALLALPGAGQYLTGSDVVARSFFGSYRVVTSGDLRHLYSGTTLHGQQSLDPTLADTPLSYYHPHGPVGDWLPAAGPSARVGAVGLGAGSIAAYGRPGQSITFHEIDPTVVDLARERFTYVARSPADVDVVLGDGRLTLADMPEDSYDVLVLDAFSSDSIPVHLLTLEAFEVYARALDDDGLLLVHVSNRYLDLEPVVASGASALGWDVRTGHDGGGSAAGGRAGSVWMALTGDSGRFDGLDAERWQVPARADVTWTDSFSNLWSVVR